MTRTKAATLRNRIIIVIVVVVAILVLGLMLLSMVQRKFIYFPDNSSPPPASSVIDDAQDVQLTTSDGLDLDAWYVPAGQEHREVTVIVAHGNGGNRADRASLARALSDAGFDVLLFDYRGYGGNPGSPSEDGLARDARAAHQYVTEELGTPGERLLYFGESLGTGVVTELATEHPPAGILLRSPFTDLAAMGQKHYPFLPVRLILRESYPVKEHVAELQTPITVVYGTSDEIVPPEQSIDVSRAAAGPAESIAIDGAGHNDPVMVENGPVITATKELAKRSIE